MEKPLAISDKPFFLLLEQEAELQGFYFIMFEQLIGDFILRMGLALPLEILVAVRAGKIPALNSLNMEDKMTNLTLDVLKEEIVNRLFILYEVYRDTTPTGDGDLPEGVNFHDVSERVLFSVDNIHWLNHIYRDLVDHGSRSEYFVQVIRRGF